MNRFKEFRREKRVKLTPSTPKGIGERNNASVVIFQLFFIATSKVQSAEGIKQKSPGMMPSSWADPAIFQSRGCVITLVIISPPPPPPPPPPGHALAQQICTRTTV